MLAGEDPGSDILKYWMEHGEVKQKRKIIFQGITEGKSNYFGWRVISPAYVNYGPLISVRVKPHIFGTSSVYRYSISESATFQASASVHLNILTLKYETKTFCSILPTPLNHLHVFIHSAVCLTTGP
jgi:hypothetical protein